MASVLPGLLDDFQKQNTRIRSACRSRKVRILLHLMLFEDWLTCCIVSHMLQTEIEQIFLFIQILLLSHANDLCVVQKAVSWVVKQSNSAYLSNLSYCFQQCCQPFHTCVQRERENNKGVGCRFIQASNSQRVSHSRLNLKSDWMGFSG